MNDEVSKLSVEALQSLNENIASLHALIELQDKRIEQIWTFLEVAGIAEPSYQRSTQ